METKKIAEIIVARLLINSGVSDKQQIQDIKWVTSLINNAVNQANEPKNEESTALLADVINWVAVRDKLPDDESEVMICTSTGLIRVVRYSAISNVFYHNCEYPALYWAEMPKQPCL